MPYYLVEYQLERGESFPGHGGHMTRRGKLLGITSNLRPNYRIVTRNDNYDYENEIFPVLYSFATHIGRDVDWNENTGEVVLMNSCLDFKKMKKKMELKNTMVRLLSESDDIAMRISTMAAEGFTEQEINEEKQRYNDVLSRRRTIKRNYDRVLQMIQNCTNDTQVLNIDIEAELLRPIN